MKGPEEFTTEQGLGLRMMAEVLQVGLERLGVNGAATSMGAIEALAKEVKEGTEAIADALLRVAEAIRDSGGV